MDWSKLSEILTAAAPERPFALMGFDGFVDTVGRPQHGDGRFFGSMASLGEFLSARGEKSCSLEVSRSVRKMGGNTPITANALATMGIPVACVGALGLGSVEPAFQQMDPLCDLWPVAMPGECLALEFQDSKLFLADMSGPRELHWEGIKQSVGLDKLIGMAARADLLGLFNWGELPNIQPVWEGFAAEVLPRLNAKKRTALFDFSDCSGRSAASIRSALAVIREFRRYMRVVLSANDNEVQAIAQALEYKGQDALEAGEIISRSGMIDLLVHHSLTYARVFDGKGHTTVNGIHIDHPVLVTGGGDHFNAGLCLGLIAGLPDAQCAQLGNTVSRIYVSTGESPRFADVLAELELARDSNSKEEVI